MLILLLIAVLDFGQPLLMPWRPKFVGAIAGGLIYLAVAAFWLRGCGRVLLVPLLLPVVPVGTLLLHVFGVSLPVAPDFMMLVVLALQLIAAALSWRQLAYPGSDRTGSVD